MTQVINFFSRRGPGATALFALIWAQGAIVGYFVHLWLFGDFSSVSLTEFIDLQISQNMLSIIYIEIGTSASFAFFGWAVGLILRNLQHLNGQLQHLSQVKDQYVTRCSHDLKSPLANMRGFAELLYHEGELGKDEREMAGCILKNVDELKLFIDDILDLNDSQILSEKLSLEKIDVNAIARQVVSQHANLAAKKGISISFHGDSSSPAHVMGHPTLMTRCLGNLVSNAVKFTRSSDKIIVMVETSSSEIFIKVEDSGIGIPPDKIAELFSESSFRRRGTAGERSSGIGLKVVTEAVKSMSGRLSVQSVEGKGSQFGLSFPNPETTKSAHLSGDHLRRVA